MLDILRRGAEPRRPAAQRRAERVDLQFLEYAYAVLPAWGMHRMGPQAAHIAWQVIAAIKVSTSRTQIVAGSKMLHHLLPDLIPPIDRQYTFSFFTGQKMVPSDHAAFLDWFPQPASIGMRCREPIRDTINRGGFMATGEAKVIDNAIMGFMQQQRLPGP